MSHPDTLRWNKRYAAEPERWLRRKSHALVTERIDLLSGHALALEIACGPADTGIFLAEHGYQVIGLDISDEALRLAQTQARATAVSLSLAQFDLTDPWLPAAKFDLILNFYFLSRPLFPTLERALKPGGLLFFETYRWEPGITLDIDHYLQPGELLRAFPGWDIIYHAEIQKPLKGQSESRQVEQLIARKPLNAQPSEVFKTSEG
jgi:tellurite methyltransferase